MQRDKLLHLHLLVFYRDIDSATTLSEAQYRVEHRQRDRRDIRYDVNTHSVNDTLDRSRGEAHARHILDIITTTNTPYHIIHSGSACALLHSLSLYIYLDSRKSHAIATMRAISLIALVPLLATTLFSTPALAEEDGVIVPFSKFGACGVNCGDLYAVQGKCSNPTVDKNCFCSDPKLAGLTQSGPWAVCCVNTDAGEDITPIKTWFAQYCGKAAAAPGTPTTAAAGAKTSTTGTSTGTAAAQTSGESEAKKKQNQTW